MIGLIIKEPGEQYMVWTIAKKEIMDTIAGPKFVVTFLVGTFLMLLAVYTGMSEYRADVKEYNAAVAFDKRNLESQTDINRFLDTGIRINRTPEALGIIIRGIQNDEGRQAKIDIMFDPELTESKHGASPLLAVFDEIDLLLIVKVILSLFAILFTYNAVAGDKEQGTLKLSLAHAVSRNDLILGKVMGNFISLMVPLAVPFLICALFLAASPGIALSGGDWVRIGLMLVLFALYISLFFMLGIMVSTLAARSSHSLFILLFAWCFFLFIIPSMMTLAAKRLYPIPSAHEITARKDAIIQDTLVSVPDEKMKWITENPQENTSEWRKKYTAFIEALGTRVTEKQDKLNSELERDFQLKRNTQLMISVNLSRLSPVSALTFGSMSLGRTGVHELNRFSDAIRNYKKEFTRWAIPKNMRTVNTGKPLDLSDMPRFGFRPESLSSSLFRAIPDFTILLGEILLLLLGAVIAFRRYDVR